MKEESLSSYVMSSASAQSSEKSVLSVRSVKRFSPFHLSPRVGLIPAHLSRLRRISFIILAAKPILITDY